MGQTTAATHADHVIPHRGDEDLFWHGDLQSLCPPCHNSLKQRQETGGWSSMADNMGYPVDSQHPQNQRPKSSPG